MKQPLMMDHGMVQMGVSFLRIFFVGRAYRTDPQFFVRSAADADSGMVSQRTAQ